MVIKIDDVFGLLVHCVVVTHSKGFLAADSLAGRFIRLQKSGRKDFTVQPYIPPEARLVSTPFKIDGWAAVLANHPKTTWVGYLLDGLRYGVRIVFDYSQFRVSAKENCQSVLRKPEVVEKYIQNEVRAGNLAGPYCRKGFTGCKVNRFGVIPRSTPGKWRLIVHLSHPGAKSVNGDAITMLPYLFYYLFPFYPICGACARS